VVERHCESVKSAPLFQTTLASGSKALKSLWKFEGANLMVMARAPAAKPAKLLFLMMMLFLLYVLVVQEAFGPAEQA